MAYGQPRLSITFELTQRVRTIRTRDAISAHAKGAMPPVMSARVAGIVDNVRSPVLQG